VPVSVRKLVFGHSPARLHGWQSRVRACLTHGARTPFYLFGSQPVADAIAELDTLRFGRPVCHWLSCKTQPVAPLLRWWHGLGRPIEVVSEFEFRAALAEGFAPADILVNGPAKQQWLPLVSTPGLRVNFDSLRELAALLPLARRQRWRTGLRLATREEFDPEFPEFPTQFGLSPDEAITAVRRLTRAGLAPETAHFHVRTNIASAEVYARALNQVAQICAAARWAPRQLDLGGGLPPPHTLDRTGRRFDAKFRLTAYAAVIRRTWENFPSIETLWLENGRFVSAGAGVLVVRILDVKERRGLRQLICDGGRTLNALVSTWEQHELLPLERQSGRRVLTAVHGPTCMAFDLLARRPLPASLQPGHRLIWLEAGAYHIPWETRFSHGLAEVWWDDAGQLSRAREAESFTQFWGAWKRPEREGAG
jgi:diaminopimelate decarboxylase